MTDRLAMMTSSLFGTLRMSIRIKWPACGRGGGVGEKKMGGTAVPPNNKNIFNY